MPEDKIYAKELDAVPRFTFDEQVAAVFEDMIVRSVPGYAATLKQIGTLAAHYVCDHSQVYDLGCSLGAASISILENIQADDVRLIAVDNAPAMLDSCRQHLSAVVSSAAVELLCEDIRDLHISQASMVVLNFTLQFIPLSERDALIKSIYEGMIPGSILVISEKIKLADPAANDFMRDMHHAFKKANGYSDLEISQKRSAIEDVLIPELVESHRQRLLNTGFSAVEQWFQCFNFISMVARK